MYEQWFGIIGIQSKTLPRNGEQALYDLGQAQGYSLLLIHLVADFVSVQIVERMTLFFTLS